MKASVCRNRSQNSKPNLLQVKSASYPIFIRLNYSKSLTWRSWHGKFMEVSNRPHPCTHFSSIWFSDLPTNPAIGLTPWNRKPPGDDGANKFELCTKLLTGWWFFATPLKNMKISWDYEIPNGKIKNVPNHQPVLNMIPILFRISLCHSLICSIWHGLWHWVYHISLVRLLSKNCSCTL